MIFVQIYPVVCKSRDCNMDIEQVGGSMYFKRFNKDMVYLYRDRTLQRDKDN